jgi:hypothetical protein
MFKNSTFFAGLEIGDKHSHITIVDQDGVVIEETRLPTTKASLQRKFSALQPCRVAMEVGAHSRWASHLLQGLGHDVLVANARKLRAIYHNPRKDDRVDAETLARLARLDPEPLSPIHHPFIDVASDTDFFGRCLTFVPNHFTSLAEIAIASLNSPN